MMDPTTSWMAQPQDIGTVVAIVGTKGWQCRLCSSTFPRSFSIDHHMVASHFQQIQEESVLPSANSTAPAGGHGDQGVRQAQDEMMQDASSVGGSGQAGIDKTNDKAGLKEGCSEVLDGMRSASVSSEAYKDCRQGEGFVGIKVEPGVNSQNASEKSMDEGSLPVYFDDGMKQQNVTPSVGRGNMDSPRQDTTVIKTNEKLKAGVNSEENCSFLPFMECENAHGSSCQARRSGMQKVADPHKPYKRRTCSCGQDFESKHEFRHHRRSVHCRLKHKSFICHICDAEYQYKRGLNRHLIEKGTVPHPCGHCLKQFHDQFSLKEHRKLCHNSEGTDPSTSEINAAGKIPDSMSENENSNHHGTEDSFPWECSKCKKHFGKKCIFREHLKECGIFVFKGGKRRFTCNLCGSSFQWLVDYHRHYVHDHKLVFLNESANSPAHYLPFTENSPVPSPDPSVTSEINTAMAGVSLNQSKALTTQENSSPCSSSVDLTSQTGQDEELSIEQDVSHLTSSPQAMSTDLKAHQVTPVASSSKPSLVPVTRPLNMLQLTSASETVPANLSEPPSLTSTTSSSNPRSFTSDFSSSYPLSLTSTASSSGQTSEVESIIISDTEEIQSSDSSSDSDEEWEIITDQNEEEKDEAELEKGGFSVGGCHKPYAPHSEHPLPPPPPPHPHPYHSFPPPPPPPPFSGEHFFPFGPHFPPPPPHHVHHHHPRFACRGFFRGRFMRGCWFGAARFGYPDWFRQEDHTHSNPTKSENATATSSCGTSAAPTCSEIPNQESGGSQHSDSAQTVHGQDPSAETTPFSHAANFSKWAGKWKEGKAYKSMWKKIRSIVLKSRQMDGQFLVCPEYDCQQTFTEESELDKHCQENHPISGEYICFICHQSVSQPVAYNRHLREHCESMFSMTSHRGRGRCRGPMGLGRKIFKHIWKWSSPYEMISSPFLGHSHQPHEADKDSNSPEASSSKEFRECPVCKKRYRANSRESFFERHVNSHYGVEVYSFECEECGKKFLEKGKLTAHQIKHKSSPYICKECGNSYQSKTSLKRHERIHTGERPHKCPDCGEGFIELRELERHRMKHTGQDPFQCKVCEKGFTLKDSLLNHVRKQHPNENPVLCCRRAMPSRSEADYHHKQSKGGVSSEPRAGNVTSGIEKGEPSSMELD